MFQVQVPTAKRPRWRQRMFGRLRSVVQVFFVLYLVAVVLLMFLETNLVYPAPPPTRGDWDVSELQHEDVWFESADGTQLHGWFLPHPQPRIALVYCHGNGEHVADNINLITVLRDRLQASVFIFDYRGYGRSAGKPHEDGLIADGLAAQQWLAKRMGWQTGDIVLMGRSLGGGVAVAMASKQGARALILKSTFSRMTDVAATQFPWLPVRLIMRNRYDSIARIKQYSGPVFQSHGTADDIVPFALGRALHDAIPSDNKQFHEMKGYGHNGYPPESYYAALAEFLDEI